jgi:hypothetical protein
MHRKIKTCTDSSLLAAHLILSLLDPEDAEDVCLQNFIERIANWNITVMAEE